MVDASLLSGKEYGVFRDIRPDGWNSQDKLDRGGIDELCTQGPPEMVDRERIDLREDIGYTINWTTICFPKLV